MLVFLRLPETAVGCVDPTGGVIMADKALRCVQVRPALCRPQTLEPFRCLRTKLCAQKIINGCSKFTNFSRKVQKIKGPMIY